MKRLLAALLFAAPVVLAPAAHGAGERIVLGELTWDGSRAVTHVLKRILAQDLGLRVEVIQAESAVIFAAMDKGKNAIDVYTDLWMPNQSEKWAKYIARGSRESVLVNEKPYPGRQGLFIPGYIQDKHGIHSVSDLADPKIAKLFDYDGDGRGDYWPGVPGWNSTNVELVKAQSYGYAEYFKPYIVSDAALKAKLKKDYRRKNGILFVYWTPEWIHTAYDLRLLEEPPFDGFAMASKKEDPRYNPKGCWSMIQPKEDEDWLAKSRVRCAWPTAKIYVAYAKSLEVRVPRAARFLKKVAFDPEAVSTWILEIGKNKRDPDEVAREWIEKNRETVREWLSGD